MLRRAFSSTHSAITKTAAASITATTTNTTLLHCSLPNSATIIQMCNRANPLRTEQLLSEFVNKTTHVFNFNDDELDVTALMDTWNIRPYELFFHMYHTGAPFGMGWLNPSADRFEEFTLEKARERLKINRCVDWHHGKAFKTCFRVDFPGQKQILPRRRFDNRNFFGATYLAVARVVDWKMNQQSKM